MGTNNSKQTQPKVKFHYYNATGRGHQARLAMAAAGIEFEDVFSDGFPLTEGDKARYLEMHDNTTFNLPILQLDAGAENEKIYIQSSAILHKINSMGDMKLTLKNDPDGDQAAYIINKAIADADGLRNRFYASVLVFGNSKEDAKNYVFNDFPKHAKNFESQLEKSGGPFWGGSSTLSLADVTIYDAICFYGTYVIEGAEGVVDPCGPALKEWIARVESNPRIKAYMEGDQYKNIAMKINPTSRIVWIGW
jgi:glutathione S-transferase